MKTRALIRGLSAGTLLITGMVTSSSFIASAQESVTPAAGQSASQSADNGQTQGAAIVGTPLLQPEIDLTRAQEIALEGQRDAVVTEIDLNGDDGFLAYSVTLDTGLEVEVDATTGSVLKSEQVDNAESEEDDGENGEDGEEEDSDENGESEEADSEENGDDED